MLYSTLLFLSFCMDFGIAETGIARGSPPGTTTELLRFGVPFAEIRVVSAGISTVIPRHPRVFQAAYKSRLLPLHAPPRASPTIAAAARC
jgi:hypothetical protein